MSVAAVASDPPAVTVVEITEPTAVNAGIELLDQEAVQLQSIALRARRVIVRLDAAAVVFHSSNLRVRTRTSVHPGLVAYVVFGPRAQGSVNGVPVRPGLMLFAEPQNEAVFVVDPSWESITFLLAPEDIRQHLAARQRLAEFRLPMGVEQLHLDPEKVRGLFQWGKRLVDAAARNPALFNDGPRERTVARVELLEGLLSILGGAEDYEPTRNERTRQAHSVIVKKAEDYLLAQTGDHVGVSDLCRVAAASERALENAFKEIMGMTPVAYLTRVRLHRVREALLKGTQGTTTVSAEALRWGFWHFGEFSRAYKGCFGELPSDTLRKKPA
ncbi:MAG TPA: helix-turn-helix domain-containing protein [Usitatibacter sp.]|nr:helix-turn-helix domain-containing protein [Usitatibacter sp.]